MIVSDTEHNAIHLFVLITCSIEDTEFSEALYDVNVFYGKLHFKYEYFIFNRTPLHQNCYWLVIKRSFSFSIVGETVLS